MGLIKNLQRYALKPIPVPGDFVIGSDSENFGKTVSFSLESLGFGEGEPGLQNNRIFIIWAESVVSGSPEAQIAASINSRVNTVEVLYDQIPIIKAFTVIDTVVYELSYGIIGKGKGVYGQGGTVTLTAGDLTLINTRVVFQIPSLENPSVRLFDLGEIADGDFIAVINQGNYTIEAGDVVFFEFTELGVRNLYSFIGDPGDYGLNETQMTLNDVFLVVSDETPSNTGAFIPLSGTTAGNPVTGDIQLQGSGHAQTTNIYNGTLGAGGAVNRRIEITNSQINLISTQGAANSTASIFVRDNGQITIQGENLDNDNNPVLNFVNGNVTLQNSSPASTPYIAEVESDLTTKKYVDDAIRQDSAIIRQKITITGSAFRTLNSSPVTLIPAPGAGKLIVLNSIITYFDFGTVQADYSFSAYAITGLSGSGTIGNLNFGSDTVLFISQEDLNNNIAINQPIILSNTVGDATVGDSTLNVYVTYEIITL